MPSPGDIVLIQYVDPLAYLGANSDDTLLAAENSEAVFTDDKFKWSVEAAVSGNSEHLSFLNLATGGYLKRKRCTTGIAGGAGLAVSWMLNSVDDGIYLKDSKQGQCCGISVQNENDQEHLVERDPSCSLSTIRFIRTATNEAPEVAGITAMHNAERAMLGYEPLEWDENLAAEALDSVESICSGNYWASMGHWYSDESAGHINQHFHGWFEAVNKWRLGGQMVSPETTKLGCSYSSTCPNSPYRELTSCHYLYHAT